MFRFSNYASKGGFVAAIVLSFLPARGNPPSGEAASASDWSHAVYVSPAGRDDAPGTAQEPLATIAKAVDRVGSSSAGVIALKSGTYRESVALTGGGGPLTLCAAPNETPVFEGGDPISGWEEWTGKPGLYAASLHAIDPAALTVWDDAHRVRFLKELDPAGVTAWRGSFCLLEDGRLLVHTVDNARPLGLWHNRTQVAFDIKRDNITLIGLQFRNYVGSRMASAVSISSAAGLQVRDCEVTNAARGVAVDKRASHVRVSNCRFRDVGVGIEFNGTDLDAENCLIVSADGDFAFRQEIDFDQRDGIRFYHPAQGGTVTGCVTAGFWAGLYEKTGLSVNPGEKDALPFICERNIFLDGIKTGDSSQALNRYASNIIFGGKSTLVRLKALGAKVESNYFFSFGKAKAGPSLAAADAGNGNVVGLSPFADLGKGDLSLRAGVAFAPAAGMPVAEKAIAWPPEIVATLNPPPDAPALQFTGIPSCVSSSKGAILEVGVSLPVAATLRYRKPSETKWTETTLADSAPFSREAFTDITGETADDSEENDPAAGRYNLVFPLISGQLQPDTAYEYEIEAGVGKDTIRSAPGQFQTSGGSKSWFVESQAKESGADGSKEHPFGQLQAALDRALPGDHVEVGEGVYIRPSVLTHGGTAEAPLVIEGAGDTKTILDGARRLAVLIAIHDAAHIAIRSLQVRFFGKAGIAADGCEALSIEHCRFLNKTIASDEYANGVGLFLRKSAACRIDHCVFTRTLYGLVAQDSPGLEFVNNTAFKNLFSSANLVQSSRGSVVTGNSFNFSSIASLVIRENDPAAFASMTCDYNNYGTLLADHASNTQHLRPENDFAPADRYGKIRGSKRIIDFVGPDPNRKEFFRMGDWRKFSDKDAHSIFADPQYADPLKGDFRLVPQSPNILTGSASIPVIGADDPVSKTAPN